MGGSVGLGWQFCIMMPLDGVCLPRWHSLRAAWQPVEPSLMWPSRPGSSMPLWETTSSLGKNLMKKGKECLVSVMLSVLAMWDARPPKSAGSSQTTSLILGLFVSFRYNSVLNSCCLRPDLAILPNSDLTEVQAFCPWWGVCFAERTLAGLCHLLGVHLKCMREKPTQWDSLSLGLYVRKYLYLRAGIINTLCFKHINISYFTWILNQIPLLVQS